MFFLLLLGLIVGAGIHMAMLKERTTRSMGEVALLWLLVGYCGVATLAFSVVSLVAPDTVARWNGFPAGNPYQSFGSLAFLAMSIISLLAMRFRGSYRIAPALAWAVFWAGATAVHLQEAHTGGTLTHGGILGIFLTHGLISVLLLGSLAASGLLSRD